MARVANGAMATLVAFPLQRQKNFDQLLNSLKLVVIDKRAQKTQEIYTIETCANIHGVTYQTARTDLLALKDMGLLEMRKEGKKFIFTPVADIALKLVAEQWTDKV